MGLLDRRLGRLARIASLAGVLLLGIHLPPAVAGQDDWPAYWQGGLPTPEAAVLDEAFAALKARTLDAGLAARAEARVAQLLDRDRAAEAGPRDARIRTGRAWMFLGELQGAQEKNDAMAASERRGLALLEAALPPDDLELADTLDSHANSLALLGQPQAAMGLLQRALDIREKALGPDHPGTAISLNNLAMTNYGLGRFAEALPFQQRVLAIYEKVLGTDHPGTATSLNNLAQIYLELGGPAEALPLTERALAIREKALGPDHPDTARGLDSLAGTYRALGRPAEALPFHQRALAAYEKVFGQENRDTANGLNNLAQTYSNLDRYSEALSVHVRALVIREKVLGPDHRDTATSLNNLAVTYDTLGRFAEALPLHQRALAIREKALGPDHPDTAFSLNNLAASFADLGRFAEALPLKHRALAIREKALGPDHPDTANSLSNLAGTYRDLGRFAEALPLEQRALGIREKALGPDHPDTASSLNNLAASYADLGRSAEALTLSQRALAICEKVLGPNHPATARSLNNLAVTYADLGRFTEALPLHQRALAIREKALGPDHPDTASSLNNLAASYADLGRFAEALPLKHRALAIREKALGPDHPATATSLNNLAASYADLGRPAEALTLSQRALAICEKALGPDHPDTLFVLGNLSWNLTDLGRPTDALALLDPAFPRAAVLDTPSVQILFFNTYARALRSTAHPALAIYHGKQAVAAVQAIRGSLASLDRASQQAFVEQYRATYERLAGWLIEAERIPEALEVLGMLKEQEFHEFQLPLRGADPAADAADPRRTRITWSGPERPHADTQAALEARMQTTTRELFPLAERARDPLKAQGLTAADQARLAELRQVREAELAEFAAFAGRLSDALGGARPPPAATLPDTAQSRRLAEIVAQLAHQAGQEVVLLHYVVTAERLYVVLQSAEGSRSLSHPVPAAELLRKIVALRQAIARPSGDPRPAAQALHADLMAPVLPLLAGRTPLLMLALTGPLRYVPFAALHDGERYLVERHALSLLHPAALARVDAPRRPAWQVQGFGLSRAVPGFPALAAVRQELDGIGGLYGPASRFWLDADFTEQRLLESFGQPRPVLHLASHFVLAPGAATESFLVLGDGGRFSLARAGQLDFSGLDLLVLSACETAMPGGRDAEGREVESFGALAQVQGAGAVLASLWRVADGSTAELMRRFYDGRELGLSKAEALRRAQLAFLAPPPAAQVAAAPAGDLRGLTDLRPAGTALSGGPARPAISLTPETPATPAAPGGMAAAGQASPPPPFLGRRHPFFWAPFVIMGNWL